MPQDPRCVLGIDVGGHRKGFHGVAISGGSLLSGQFRDVDALVSWCQPLHAQVIAVDAPCAWAVTGSSRLAERSLSLGGVTIQCFKTPTRAAAQGNAFYDWVFNGEALYHALSPAYRIYDGMRIEPNLVFETFPHAVVCALAGQVVPARPKAATRRAMLRQAGYDDRALPNIDFVDAALCALTAERFLAGRTRQFGDAAEGFIVVPR